MRTAIGISEIAHHGRVDMETVRSQYQAFIRTHCRTFFDAIPAMIFALNKCRQIVFANQAGIEFFNQTDVDALLGRRPGEAVGCINAASGEAGCGTSVHCGHCQALAAILKAIGGSEDSGQCHMLRRAETRLEGLNLLVKATPINVEAEEFVIFTITDVTHEHRRRAMERIFFHDVLNLAGGLRGLAELLLEKSQERGEELGILYAGLESLVDEIMAQRELSAAENGELALTVGPVGSRELLAPLVNLYASLPVARGRTIVLAPDCEDFVLRTDARILSRVLGNLIKNGLEAEAKGGVVTLSCRVDGDQARFGVHNHTVIPEELQQDIFRRSFSTKRPDRGLGLYSVLLLTERYLNGEPGFTSSHGCGTEFFLRLPLALAQTSNGAPMAVANV